MKYINKREDFLNKSKHNKIGKLINEEAGGPFTNDIPWGDSLVGRLINAIVRKSGIAINVNRIQKLIPRLKELFDQILEDSKISKDSQVKIWKLKVFALLQKLKNAVDNEEEINVLVYITDDLITIVDSDYVDDKNKKTLLDELKKFKEFLLSLKDESPEEKEEEKEEVKPVSTNTQEIPFDFCVKNLKAVYAILLAYKKLKDADKKTHISKKDSTGKEIEVGQVYTYDGKKVKVIDLRNPTLGTGTMADNNVYVVDISKDKPGNTGYPAIVNKLKPITESTTPVVNPVLPKQNSIFNAIKPVYGLFTREKDIFADLEKFFKMSPENQKNSKFKNPILKIYNIARKLNEDLNNFLTRPEDIGESLITMYKSTKVKEDGSFDGIQDDMKLAIADFNKTMKSILLFQSGIGEKSKKEVVKPEVKKEDDIDFENKNRSNIVSDSVKLLKYNKFLHINELMTDGVKPQTQDEESEKPQSQGQLESEEKTNTQKIKDYFEKNVNYNVWGVELSEVKRIDSEIEQESKDNKELVINGIDPIIEILKLFNRAYKLHTTNNIPGGRSGGAVSRSVYNEYTPFGGSGGQSGISDGPYRNNKIFNVWEDAVLDIMKERKYQPIFSKETKIRIGDKLIAGAGSTFKKLITGLLDTEKLYNKGAQQKFLNEYFGPDAVPEGTKLGVANDENVNGDTSGKIREEKLKFIDKTFDEKYEGKFLQLKDDKKTVYLYLDSIIGDMINIIYCNSTFGLFKSEIKLKEKVDIDFEKADIDFEKTNNTDDYNLRYTRINKNDFKDFLKKRTIKLNSVTWINKTAENYILKPVSIKWLVKPDETLFTCKTFTDKGQLDTLLGQKYKNKDGEEFEPISKIV